MICKFCQSDIKPRRRDTYWFCPECGCMVVEKRFLESTVVPKEIPPTIEDIEELIADEVTDKPVGFIEPNTEPKGFSVPQKNTTVLNSKHDNVEADEKKAYAEKKAKIEKKIADGKKAYIKKKLASKKKAVKDKKTKNAEEAKKNEEENDYEN